MKARSFASLIWIVLLLLAPLRSMISIITKVIWPDAFPFSLVSQISNRWGPFIFVTLFGYLITCWLIRYAMKRTENNSINKEIFRSVGSSASVKAGLIITLVWCVSQLLMGQLSVTLALVGVLIYLGLVVKVAPEPAPDTKPDVTPLPSPPEHLPDTVEFEDEEASNDIDETDDAYIRTFDWFFNEEPYNQSGRTHHFTAKFQIPKKIYKDYKDQSHTVYSDLDYVKFANAELDDEVVAGVASKLRSLSDKTGLDSLGEIHLVMAFVLSIQYASDDEEYGTEYPKFPVETLVDHRGDCEDHAILGGVILHRLGYVAAIALTDTHAALGVEADYPIEGVSFSIPELGTDLYYCEVTPGANITTEDTPHMQYWLGMEPDRGIPYSFYPIG